MRILAIYRHYWPDTTPYARILKSLMEDCADRGFDVTVVTAQPSYNDIGHDVQPWREELNGVKIIRLGLMPERKQWKLWRSLNFMLFLTRAVAHAVFHRKYDVVVANSHPPLLMGWALRIVKFFTGTPYIYHCQDVHPESAKAIGKLQSTTLYRMLRHSDAATCRLADRVIVLSDDMLDAIRDRGVSTNNVSIINNPPLARQDLPASPGVSLPDGFRVVFAGNLGSFQGLDAVVRAARQVDAQVPLRLIFMGEGACKAQLQQQAGDLLDHRVFFVPHLPVEQAFEVIRECHLGLISLLPEVYRYAFPSKSMMYLAAGCPLLAVMEPESELARTIQYYSLGYCSPSRQPADIAAQLERAYRERDDWGVARRFTLAKIGEELYGSDSMLSAWRLQFDAFSPRPMASPHMSAPRPLV